MRHADPVDREPETSTSGSAEREWRRARFGRAHRDGDAPGSLTRKRVGKVTMRSVPRQEPHADERDARQSQQHYENGRIPASCAVTCVTV